MKHRKCISILIVAVFTFVLILSSVVVEASPTSVFCPDPDSDNPDSVCGERFGWSANNWKHIDNDYAVYYFNNSLSDREITSAERNMVRRGAAMWRAEMGFQFEARTEAYCTGSSNPYMTGYVYATYGNTEVTAAVRPKVNQNSYIQSWTLWFNFDCTVTDSTFAHEFGHILGLNDLYFSSNRNKLMYGVEKNRIAVRPSSLDVWAAKVMTCKHTSHSWTGGYQYIGMTEGVGYHTKKCSSCGGGALRYVTKCVYDASFACKYCGRVQNFPRNASGK